MSQSTNWGALLTQGRCKAFGVPWSDKEAYAVFVLKIPAENVRQGCLTLEDYESAKKEQQVLEEKTKKVQLIHLKRSQLVALCEKQGIQITNEATRSVLLELLLDNGCLKSIPISEVPEIIESET